MKHMKKSWNRIGVIMAMMAAVTLCGCEGGKNTEPQEEPKVDPREAFVGEYAFTSKGDIDLYAGVLKLLTIPMDQQGDMTITPGDSVNTVWVIAGEDSTKAYVSGENLFMDPTKEEMTYGEVVMELSFTYGKATLSNDTLSLATDVEISATFRERGLTGSGKVDIVAVKRVSE